MKKLNLFLFAMIATLTLTTFTSCEKDGSSGLDGYYVGNVNHYNGSNDKCRWCNAPEEAFYGGMFIQIKGDKLRTGQIESSMSQKVYYHMTQCGNGPKWHPEQVDLQDGRWKYINPGEWVAFVRNGSAIVTVNGSTYTIVDDTHISGSWTYTKVN